MTSLTTELSSHIVWLNIETFLEKSCCTLPVIHDRESIFNFPWAFYRMTCLLGGAYLCLPVLIHSISQYPKMLYKKLKKRRVRNDVTKQRSTKQQSQVSSHIWSWQQTGFTNVSPFSMQWRTAIQRYPGSSHKKI